MKDFRTKIIEVCEGTKTSYLAKMSDLSPSALSRIKSSAVSMDIQTAVQISEGLKAFIQENQQHLDEIHEIIRQAKECNEKTQQLLSR